MTNQLRDILYFDFDKAASLISQIEGGLVQSRTTGSEEIETERNIRQYNILKAFNAEFGGVDSEKRTILETKVLHHDLLSTLEEFLLSQKFSIHVNSMKSDTSLISLRTEISKFSYLKVEGKCLI